MRVAFLSNYFPHLTETFIYREALELQRRGVRLKTYSIRKPDMSKISSEAVNIYHETFYLLPVSIWRLFICHAKYVSKSPLKYIKALFLMIAGSHTKSRDRLRSLMHFGEGVVLADRMEKDEITHVHAHFASQSTSVARAVHLLTGIPYSFSAHAHDIWHDRLLIPEKLKEAKFVACCSQYGKKRLLEQSAGASDGKVHIVYHGLDIKRFSPPPDDGHRERNLVLSIGRLTEQKGFSYLIKAFALLVKNGFKAKCEIVGDGELMEELNAMIREMGIKEAVRLVGPVPQEDILGYYHRAWAFVLPCVDTKDGNRDGIPNVLMEAMATGVPVVTTTNSGQAELIEDGIHGLLVRPCSPSDLAASIVRICTDMDLRRNIRIEARNRMVDCFDGRNTIKPLVELYSRIVDDLH